MQNVTNTEPKSTKNRKNRTGPIPNTKNQNHHNLLIIAKYKVNQKTEQITTNTNPSAHYNIPKPIP